MLDYESVIAWLLIVSILASGIYFAPKGWRTWVFNGLSVAISVVLAILDATSGFDWTELVGEKHAPLVAGVLGLVNIALRAVTTTRAGMPKPEAPATKDDVVPL